MTGDDLSVIVPTRDHRNYVRECLKALILQREAPAEILVVDRGSQDNTLEIIAENFPSVRVLRMAPGAGLSKSLNEGIRAVSRPLVALVFPEVKLDKGYFQAILAELDRPENGKVGFASGKIFRMFGGPRILDSAGLVFNGSGPFPRRRAAGERDQGRYETADRVFGAPQGAAVFRRRALEETAQEGEVFDESLDGVLEDVDLCWRARGKGWEGLYVPTATAFRDSKGEGRGPTYGDALRWEYGRRAVLLKNARAHALLLSLPRLLFSDAARLLRDPAACVPLVFSVAMIASRWPELRRKRQRTLKP
ncbi:MAG: glycosyltransferase family 2 protein [Planctomycetes bacterium]|nr:glycosyltransferase family 2 protein [Planctomycetota bacterium]